MGLPYKRVPRHSPPPPIYSTHISHMPFPKYFHTLSQQDSEGEGGGRSEGVGDDGIYLAEAPTANVSATVTNFLQTKINN